MTSPLLFREYDNLGYNLSYSDWEALRPITCAFSGHRPQSFPFKFDENSQALVLLKKRLAQEIEQAIQDDYSIFLSGGALGVDTWAAQIVLKFREFHYPFIRLELVLPCTGQENKWNKKSKETYAKLIDEADAVIRTSRQPYFEGCMKLRNEFMISRSSRLIAVWNKKPSGTSQTVAMARNQGLEVRLMDARGEMDNQISLDI